MLNFLFEPDSGGAAGGGVDLLDGPRAIIENLKRSQLFCLGKWIFFNAKIHSAQPLSHRGLLLHLVETDLFWRSSAFKIVLIQIHLPFFLAHLWPNESNRAKYFSTIQKQQNQQTEGFVCGGCRAAGGHGWVALLKDKCEGNSDEERGLFQERRWGVEVGGGQDVVKTESKKRKWGSGANTHRGVQPWLWDVTWWSPPWMRPLFGIHNHRCVPASSSYTYRARRWFIEPILWAAHTTRHHFSSRPFLSL